MAAPMAAATSAEPPHTPVAATAARATPVAAKTAAGTATRAWVAATVAVPTICVRQRQKSNRQDTKHESNLWPAAQAQS
eukprot:337961-Chlamydomonas_euryale.AAC.1